MVERSLVLPGTSGSYVRARIPGNRPYFWGGADFTWAIRVKINVTGSPRAEGIISHGSGWRGTGAYLILKHGRLHFVTNNRVVADSQPFPSGEWVTVVATKDRFGNLRLYRDGELRAYRYADGSTDCAVGEPCQVSPVAGGTTLLRPGRGSRIPDPDADTVDVDVDPRARRPARDSRWDVSKRPLVRDPFLIGALINETNRRTDFFLDGEVKAIEIYSKALTEAEVSSHRF